MHPSALLCRLQRAVHILLRVSQRHNRMQRGRWRGVNAERKQRQHKLLERRTVDEPAELAVVADGGLLGKH
jgi:hypothetical protein